MNSMNKETKDSILFKSMEVFFNNNCDIASSLEGNTLNVYLLSLRDKMFKFLKELETENVSYETLTVAVLLYIFKLNYGFMLSCKVQNANSLIKEEFGDLADYAEQMYNVEKDCTKHVSIRDFQYLNLFLQYKKEYKDVLNFAKENLANIKCKITGEEKFNHSTRIGFKLYQLGFLKSETIVAGILRNVLKYSKNSNISFEVESKFGQKATKTFSNMSDSVEDVNWLKRRNNQIAYLKSPSNFSFTAAIILTATQYLNLKDISDKLRSSDGEIHEEDLKKFWKEYANITPEQAQGYYSSIFNLSNDKYRAKFSTGLILDEYEDVFKKLFGCYPE